MSYSFQLAAIVILCAPYHRQDSTYFGFHYTSRGALDGTRNSSMKHMRQYQKLSKFWQGKNIKTSVFRTCILITQNTEQVLRISELLSVIQNSYIYGNHGNLKMELTLPVPSCYQSLFFFRRL